MKILLLLISVFNVFAALGQQGFRLLNDRKNSFRFEIDGNLVVVPVKINGLELDFLLDTGVKETILFLSKGDSIPLENVHKVKFSGIGIEDGVEGIMSTGNTVEVGEIMVDSLHLLYVIGAEDLDISSHVGIPINGILGSHFFKDHLVKLNYQRRRISMYDAFDYSTRLVRGYKRIPIRLERNRPYTRLSIDLGERLLPNANMLVDMGNSDGLLVFPFLIDSLKIREPSIYEYIGKGFSGLIYGRRNRIAGFNWADFYIKHPIVSYPDSNAVHVAMLAEGRIGSVGSQVLQHFYVFFNYPKREMYLKPNRKFGDSFSFNLSGLDVRHDGLVWTQSRVRTNLASAKDDLREQGTTVFQEQNFRYEFLLKPIYIIANVREGSPGGLAGAQVGDELLRINGKRVENMKLKQILHTLQHKQGDRLSLLIRRDDQQVMLHFKLMDPIPFVPDEELL
ncbi:MAG: PDZ domain-containing protein [Sphingobacteriaceae bacterium]